MHHYRLIQNHNLPSSPNYVLVIEFLDLRFIWPNFKIRWCLKFVICSNFIISESVSHLFGNAETFSHLSLTAMPWKGPGPSLLVVASLALSSNIRIHKRSTSNTANWCCVGSRKELSRHRFYRKNNIVRSIHEKQCDRPGL